MNNIMHFINKFEAVGTDINNVFLKRYNKNENNKLNFKNTLYASILALKIKELNQCQLI